MKAAGEYKSIKIQPCIQNLKMLTRNFGTVLCSEMCEVERSQKQLDKELK